MSPIWPRSARLPAARQDAQSAAGWGRQSPFGVGFGLPVDRLGGLAVGFLVVGLLGVLGTLRLDLTSSPASPSSRQAVAWRLANPATAAAPGGGVRVVTGPARQYDSSFARSSQDDTDLADPVDYETQIKPILTRHCLECHGPERDISGFRVDRQDVLLAGGEYGLPAIVPGDPDDSFLLQVLEGTSDDLSMPPEGSPPVSPSDLALLREWIAQGANFPEQVAPQEDPRDWWSLRPPVLPTIPPGESAIDYLIGRELAAKDLEFSPAADRRALIRRLYLVMLGLPPTAAEVEDFLADERADAWEQLVDRVLASPQYGERWARHWLDVVRFGETDGYETNRERPNAWRYRDWVIEAFNDDLPYNEFVRQQIAGDALGHPVGTSFLVAGPHDIVKSPDPLLTLTQRQDELTDMVSAVGSAFLGLTVGCARCHNHKFDPISQQDFFAMQAIFAGVQHAEAPLPLEAAGLQAEQLAAVESELAQWRQQAVEYLGQLDDLQTTSWPPVQSDFNLELFPPTPARWVRFEITATNSGSEPCLDELEIFAGEVQVGLADDGGLPTSSGDYAGNPKHRLSHLNDGRHGNDYSWISDTPGRGWVQIEWPEVQAVDRIQWSRDRQGTYADRLPTEYQIAVSLDGETWSTVADSQRRQRPGDSGDSWLDHAVPQAIAWHTREAEPRADAAAEPWDEASDPRLGHDANDETWGQRWQRLNQLRRELSQPPLAFCGTFSQPPVVHRLYRGDPLSPREEVLPNTLTILGDLELGSETAEPDRRLALADSLVTPDNPLVARVIVNRLWQYQFGVGLVETASDFGRNATLPSHPELLDWLALQLVQRDWSLKSLQRSILLSRTWQQSSRPHGKGLAVDAASRLLWRFPPRRLEAEGIRDSVLAVSGQLRLTGGGPGFSAFVVEMENVRHYFPLEEFGPEHWRRMIYQTKIRQEQDSVFGAFDCPDGSQIAPHRSRSTTPLQALNLFNSGFMLQQAQLMAQRLEREQPESVAEQIDAAYRLCYSRPADQTEIVQAEAFIRQEGLAAFCRVLLNSNEFLFIF